MKLFLPQDTDTSLSSCLKQLMLFSSYLGFSAVFSSVGHSKIYWNHFFCLPGHGPVFSPDFLDFPPRSHLRPTLPPPGSWMVMLPRVPSWAPSASLSIHSSQAPSFTPMTLGTIPCWCGFQIYLLNSHPSHPTAFWTSTWKTTGP